MKINLWWRKYFVHFWRTLWIRSDEFHWTLNRDTEVYLSLTKKERISHDNEFIRRRQIAHQRSVGAWVYYGEVDELIHKIRKIFSHHNHNFPDGGSHV